MNGQYIYHSSFSFVQSNSRKSLSYWIYTTVWCDCMCIMRIAWFLFPHQIGGHRVGDLLYCVRAHSIVSPLLSRRIYIYARLYVVTLFACIPTHNLNFQIDVMVWCTSRHTHTHTRPKLNPDWRWFSQPFIRFCRCSYAARPIPWSIIQAFPNETAY